ncbi:DUF2514 family protein [Pantoea sp. aB]|uniref:DUF2514 family protein n=1 Tax=Pantoea sp. aB TaxID=517433 RepID=UPI0001E09BA0|nr:DUF2514 family protein [Pantoea sp. aB]EFM18621.1 Protein of unknown function DUF2514 [Pantoea sp. aB]
MIRAFLKVYWKPLTAFLLVAGGLWLVHHIGYSSGRAVANQTWQGKWDRRDKTDAESRLAFTQQQRRDELARQAAIDKLQREADEENRKANADRIAAERAADRLQSGIQSAIAQLQQRRGSDTGTATSGKAGRTPGDLLTQLYREIDSTAGELAAEADRRGRVALTCERAYDAIRNSSLKPANK